MKRFCQKCGSGTDYTVTKPLFCGRCGVSYDSVAAATAPVKSTRPVERPLKAPEPVDEEERETNFNPDDISGLDFQILMPPSSKMVVGQIAGTGGSDEPIRTIPKKVNRKAIIDELLPNLKASKARRKV